MLMSLANGTRLGGAASALEARIQSQNALDKMEEVLAKCRVQVHAGKCQVLYLGWGNYLNARWEPAGWPALLHTKTWEYSGSKSQRRAAVKKANIPLVHTNLGRMR